MTDENIRVVEVNGVKVEVDLRTAKTIDTYKVGDNVKILIKEYSSYKSNFGVIVGFDNFVNLPTIIVAYLDIDYSGAKLKFAHINAESKEIEIVPANENDADIDKSRVVELMDKEIEESKEKVKDLERKKKYFLDYFNKYFKPDMAK